ncbi:unnamed protein product [Cylicocyclus nassatus]|uniref:Peptidase S1 domain-containing protein n=1 Tax=Cylicocyclus nassatus TaxID=53992 RepID=A0AA36HA79_CYLNA|nr:unnamed protein product [Cylicocyclus nassatus]
MRRLLWLLFLSVIASIRISEKDNQQLKKACLAKIFRRNSKYKSFGGRSVQSNEFPWLVSLLYRDKEGDKLRGEKLEEENKLKKEKMLLCSAVQISPMHVLTAAHCVLSFDPSEFKNACEKTMEFTGGKMLNISNFHLYIGSSCVHPTLCHQDETPVKIIVRDHWGKCDGSSDLAILELQKSPYRPDPICMPEHDTKLDWLLRSAGIGRDPTKPAKESNTLQTITLTENKTNTNPNLIKTFSPTSSLCYGDSGGPLFQYNAARKYMLVGIASLSTSCEKKLELRKTYFVDVRKHLSWVCEVTGVCPLSKPATVAK